MIRGILKDLNIDPKQFAPGMFLENISKAKNRLLQVADLPLQNYIRQMVLQVAEGYHRELAVNNALDFDDFLVRTVRLLQANPEVREYYQRKFHHIFGDEYHDTNVVQLQLIKLLCAHNLTVVGLH